MAVVFPQSAGWDVPNKRMTACRMVPAPTGQEAEGSRELKTFGTMTRGGLAWADWLTEARMTPVAMASTGEYWTPVSHLLTGTLTEFLVHETYVKNVPGRTTAKADARWGAQLMRFDLLQARVIPPKGQRDRWDLTRYRTKVGQEWGREGKRGRGVLARAKITRAAVLADILGVSGRARLEALIAGRAAPAPMAERAQRCMRSQIPLIEQALTGVMPAPHRQFLALQRAHIALLDDHIDALHQAREASLPAFSIAAPPNPGQTLLLTLHSVVPSTVSSPLTLARAVALLETIPGVDQRGAAVIVAEVGMAMARFEPAPPLAAWAGVAPGHAASTGTQRSGKTRKGNRPSRRSGPKAPLPPCGLRTPRSPPSLSASPYAAARSGPSLPWRPQECVGSCPCSPAMQCPAHWGPIILTNVGGSSRSIDLPGGLSTGGIGCILNQWHRPRQEKFSRQPYESLCNYGTIATLTA